jgi:hypothetical protein
VFRHYPCDLEPMSDRVWLWMSRSGLAALSNHPGSERTSSLDGCGYEAVEWVLKDKCLNRELHNRSSLFVSGFQITGTPFIPPNLNDTFVTCIYRIHRLTWSPLSGLYAYTWIVFMHVSLVYSLVSMPR